MGPYRPVVVSGAAGDVALCRWDASLTGHHLLVPDGCVELMWLEDRGLVVCGPETRAWSFDYPRARTAGGVRLRPGRAGALLGVDLSDLQNRVVDYADLAGDRAANQLLVRIESGDRVSDVLVAEIERRAEHARHDAHPALLDVGLTVAQQAAELGITQRTVHRLSTRTFGYGPTTLRAILRLQWLFRLARVHPGLPLAQLAVAAGYADQAHLGRDCRRITGLSPTRVLGTQASDWHGDADLFAAGPRTRAA